MATKTWGVMTLDQMPSNETFLLQRIDGLVAELAKRPPVIYPDRELAARLEFAQSVAKQNYDNAQHWKARAEAAEMPRCDGGHISEFERLSDQLDAMRVRADRAERMLNHDQAIIGQIMKLTMHGYDQPNPV